MKTSANCRLLARRSARPPRYRPTRARCPPREPPRRAATSRRRASTALGRPADILGRTGCSGIRVCDPPATARRTPLQAVDTLASHLAKVQPGALHSKLKTERALSRARWRPRLPCCRAFLLLDPLVVRDSATPLVNCFLMIHDPCPSPPFWTSTTWRPSSTSVGRLRPPWAARPPTRTSVGHDWREPEQDLHGSLGRAWTRWSSPRRRAA